MTGPGRLSNSVCSHGDELLFYSEMPFRLGWALLLSLTTGFLVVLIAAFWPRSGDRRHSGIYLMAG